MSGLSAMGLAQSQSLAPPGRPGHTARVEKAERRLSAYHTLVRQYRSGDRAPAIRELGGWTDSQLSEVREELTHLRSALRPGGSVLPHRWDVDDLRAAVLLQTERALVYVFIDRSASYSSHLETARFLLECVDPEESGWAEFRLEWWRSVLPWLQRRVDREGLLLYARRSVALYPNDVQVRLAAGTAFEIALWAGWKPDAAISSEPVVARDQFLRRRADRAAIEDARLAMENLSAALRLAPPHVEALLRRGRAFQLTGQDEQAIADFRAVLSLEAPSPTPYLAHLFLGSVHQTAVPPRLDEARREYEAAVREAPLAQSARLALSTVLLLMGDREGAEIQAQETLELPSETAGGIGFDPWWTYGMGQYLQALDTFGRLRRDLGKKQP